MCLARARRAVPVALLAVLLPQGPGAQAQPGGFGSPGAVASEDPVIHGRLLDAGTGAPITGGDVHLLTPQAAPLATVLTGTAGEFRLMAPGRGTYRLRAERLGYRTSTSEPFYLVPGDTVTVEFRLRVDAVELEPITVVGSSLPWGDRIGLVRMEGFFERYTRYAGTGFAEFLTRDSIAGFEDRVPTAGHMLQWTSPSVREIDPETGEPTLRNGCAPTYYLNGTRVPYEMVRPLSPVTLEAVEVYIRPAIPAELGAGAPCGVVSYWSRQSPPDELPRNPFGRALALIVLGGGTILLLLMAL